MKSPQANLSAFAVGRSRKGAWIEIVLFVSLLVRPLRRSRKGAWIEIAAGAFTGGVASSRSRKGAWIEILLR